MHIQSEVVSVLPSQDEVTYDFQAVTEVDTTPQVVLTPEVKHKPVFKNGENITIEDDSQSNDVRVYEWNFSL